MLLPVWDDNIRQNMIKIEILYGRERDESTVQAKASVVVIGNI